MSFINLRQRQCAALALLAVLAGCNLVGSVPAATPTPFPGIPTDQNGATPTPPPLLFDTLPTRVTRRNFIAASWTQDGQELLIPGTQLELNLWDSGSLGVFAGCNHMGSDYSVVDGRLITGEMSSTLIGCDNSHAIQDNRIALFLRTSPQFSIVDQLLTLTTESTVLTLNEHLLPPPTPQVNIHGVVEHVEANGLSTDVPSQMSAKLDFWDDGLLKWQVSVCALGSSTYIPMHDGTLDFTVETDTTNDCTGSAALVVEAIQTIVAADSVAFVDTGETINFDANGVTMRLRRVR